MRHFSAGNGRKRLVSGGACRPHAVSLVSILHASTAQLQGGSFGGGILPGGWSCEDFTLCHRVGTNL